MSATSDSSSFIDRYGWATEPELIHELFMYAFNAGDLDGIVALYEPEAIMISAPGEAVRGREAIREMLRQFVAVTARLQVTTGNVFTIGEIALLSSEWHISGIDAEGKSVQFGGQMADVVRRQEDGTWLIVIDNLWGA